MHGAVWVRLEVIVVAVEIDLVSCEYETSLVVDSAKYYIYIYIYISEEKTFIFQK
jgi:hypothetical protein